MHLQELEQMGMEVVPVRLRDGTILMHVAAPYDPVKAHQYYLRTRQLKGRKLGQNVVPSRKNPLVGDVGQTTYTVKLPDGSTSVVTAKDLREQRAYAAQRVHDIKTALADFSSELKKAMRDARMKKAEAERKAEKGPTAAEKSEAARESKQFREKHKTELATKAKTRAKTEPKSKSESTDPVAELETRVTQIKDSLKAAVAQQRALAGATKN
jgi:hypothetical protein